MRTALALLLCLAAAAHAETALVASIASYHLDRDRGYCEINPGIGLEHELARDVQLHVGVYEGSKCTQVSYIGPSWMGLRLPFGVRAGVGLLAFIGYEKDRSQVLWAPVPAFHVPIDARRGLNFAIFLPHDDFKGAVGLQFRMLFK